MRAADILRQAAWSPKSSLATSWGRADGVSGDHAQRDDFAAGPVSERLEGHAEYARMPDPETESSQATATTCPDCKSAALWQAVPTPHRPGSPPRLRCHRLPSSARL